MSFSKQDYIKYRFLEVIPGALTWLIFFLAIVISFIRPIWVIYFIIIFDLYWLFRILYFLVYVFISWQHFQKDIKIDWLEKVKTIPDWEKTFHLIFLPSYKEGIEIFKTTFENLVKINYPLDKFIIVLAGEERDKENFFKNAETIKKEFGDKFYKLLITLHPKDLPGDLAGKGSNIAWAGERAKEFIDQEKIPYENIIVSSFDLDSCPHPQYFSCLTYKYLTHPNPIRVSYQPLILFHNNIWDAPALARIVANGASFWLLTELVKPERLITFSSHSMSFKALVDVGFWQRDMVSEDSRIYLQAVAHYQGNYSIVPIYIPISMDAVLGQTFWQSMISIYKQQQRWAYGIENFPFMVWYFKKNQVPFLKRIHFYWNQLEGGFFWAVAPILIFILGWLPLSIANQHGIESAIIQTAPHILETTMNACMAGLFLISILSTIILPPRPQKYKKIKWLLMILQWALLPITLIIFSAIPAIDAQTRLMLGRPFGYDVTEKMRKS
ncbi:glycosyltransferase family 2 protein [Candidatus Kuenenbacteria bacterium]|nr:glycosyltransferase family 2 protein [Candidatus Kuenenbacteria bacterium]